MRVRVLWRERATYERVFELPVDDPGDLAAVHAALDEERAWDEVEWERDLREVEDRHVLQADEIADTEGGEDE